MFHKSRLHKCNNNKRFKDVLNLAIYGGRKLCAEIILFVLFKSSFFLHWQSFLKLFKLTRYGVVVSVRFAVGRLRVHSPCRVIPKNFKGSIHSFPAWRSAFSGGCGE